MGEKWNVRVKLCGESVTISDKGRLSWCRKTAMKKAREVKKDYQTAWIEPEFMSEPKIYA